MNYLSHHEVARSLASGDEDYMFGSMVPDFVGMFGVRKSYQKIANQPMLDGINLHQATDTVFDDQVPIKELEAHMSETFKHFMPKWTAVQCARVGKDLLFDGIQFGDKAILRSCLSTLQAAAIGEIDITTVAEPVDQWLSGLWGLETTGIPRYDVPAIVAQRLRNRLASSRTPIEKEVVPRLTDTLEKYQMVVLAIGDEVMNATVIQLREQGL